MGNWFTSNLGDAMLADASLDHIKALFLSEREQTSRSKEMAVFIRHKSEGRLHCEVKVYFSPATVNVAAKVDAIPCKKPSPDGLSLFIGPDESWSIFFPQDGL